MADDQDEPFSATRAWEAYRCMQTLLAGQIGRELARGADLSEADFDILSVLSAQADGKLRALALRCALGWEKSRLSHQIIRMEKRGLVLREACEEDGRGAVIGLTPAGEDAFAGAKVVHERMVARYFGEVLSPSQLAALERIAADVTARLARDIPHHPSALD